MSKKKIKPSSSARVLDAFNEEEDADQEAILLTLFKSFSLRHPGFAFPTQAASTSATAASGHIYCYIVPFDRVVVTLKDESVETDWVVLKVGRADPGKLCTRLNEEARKYKNNTCLPLDLPVLKNVSSRNPKSDADYLAVLGEQEGGCAHLIFVMQCDIGREAEVRRLFGHEIGKGHKKKKWENWLNHHDEDGWDVETDLISFYIGEEEHSVSFVKALNVGPTEFVVCNLKDIESLRALSADHTDRIGDVQTILSGVAVAQANFKLISLYRYDTDEDPLVISFKK